MKLVDKIHKEWMSKDFSVKEEEYTWNDTETRYGPVMTPEQKAECRHYEQTKVLEFVKRENSNQII